MSTGPVVRGGPDHAGKLKLRKLHPPDPAPPPRGSAHAHQLAEVTGDEIRAADVFFLGATEVMIHPVSPHE